MHWVTSAHLVKYRADFLTWRKLHRMVCPKVHIWKNYRETRNWRLFL